MKLLKIIWLGIFIVSLSSVCFSQEKRSKTIAVLDLETRGATSDSEAKTLTDRLRSLLVRTKAFKVVDRGKMEAILQEVGFQQSGCTSTECAIEVGRILNVEHMISGAIGKIGALYTIDIVSIDVESSAILKSFSEDYKGEIEGLIDLMKNIADQLAGIEKGVGSIEVKSSPIKALVLLNNKDVGVTPVKLDNVPSGEHKIKLLAQGYKEKEGKIKVKKGKLNSYDIKLQKKGSNKLLWIGTGSLVLAGGAAAAILMTNKDDKEEEKPATFPAPPGRP